MIALHDLAHQQVTSCFSEHYTPRGLHQAALQSCDRQNIAVKQEMTCWRA